MNLDFHLLGETGIILPQDLEDLGTAEMIRHFHIFGKHLAEHSAGEHQAVFLAVAAGAHGGHAVALVAVEGPVDVQRLGFQGILGDGQENLLGVKGAVVFADTGMVTADDEVGAAEVLPEDRMQQGFPGTGIAHIKRITGLNGGVFDKIMLRQGVNGFDPHFGRNVAGFQFTQQLMDQGSIKLNQMINMTTTGAVSGTFWGALIGLIFTMPLVGAAMGAASGALGGALTDLGINDKWMKETAAAIAPGTAALFVLVRKATADKVLERLKGEGGTVMKTSLDHTKEAALQAALAEAKAAVPA